VSRPVPSSVKGGATGVAGTAVSKRPIGSGADHSLMRELNRSLVLDVIKENSPISRAAIAKQTSLAKPTVSAIIDDLIAEGLVREIGPGQTTSGGGRPPILLEFNGRSQFLVGIQVGVKRTTIVVADARGEELERTEMSTPHGDASAALQRISESVHRSVAAAGASLKRLGAVGVCLPGLVDLHTGVCLLAPNLGWKDVPVAATLTASLGVPVYVVNTVDAALVVEHVEGVARGAQDAVLLYIGRGIGAAFITEGRLLHGASGLAGEIGHCHLPGASQPCNCGKVGCLEAEADARAIVRAVREAVASGRGTTLDGSDEDLRAEDVAAAAAEGDELSLEVLRDAGRRIGVAVSWLINLFNPQIVVIGGGIAGAGEPLLGPLREAALEHALPQATSQVEIKPWAFGPNATVRGAVLVALQYAETYYRVIFQG